jgi:uncharacterized protein (TIGR02271 family)
MAQTVVGIFNSAAEAQDAASKLIANGFSSDSIDVSSGRTSNSGTGSTSSDYSTMSNPGTSDTTTGYGNLGLNSTGTSEMTGTTGITGASGLNTQSSSAAHSDNEESGISRFFKNLFGSDNDDSDRFSKVASGSGAVVTVHASTADEAEEIADLLDEYGAVDVDDVYNQNYNSDNVYGNTTTDQYNTAGNLGTDTSVGTGESSTSIPIIEENLQVGKKEIETGGVRLRSRIVSRPVEESLRLREEFVRVERTPVNRAATTADLDNFQEGTIEMTETAEIPVVSKEARVVEEVSIGKEVEHHDEVIRDTVRSTEVEVEQLRSDNDRTTGSGTDLGSSSRV